MYSRILGFSRPYRGELALLAVLNLLSSVVLLTLPWLGGQLVGRLFGGIVDATRLTIFLGLAIIAIGAINYVAASHSAKVTANLLADIRQHVFGHLQCLPLAFHDERRRGDLLALTSYEIPRLSALISQTLTAIPSRILVTIGALIMMFRIDPRLALIAPLAVPLFYVLLKIAGRRLRKAARMLQQAEAQVMGIAEEALEILPATKAFTQEQAQSRRFGAALSQSRDAYIREGQITAVIEPTLGAIAALLALGVLALAGSGLDSGLTSSSEKISFLLYAALMTRPVGALAHVYGQLQVARGTIARLGDILGEIPEASIESAQARGRMRGDIEFDAVTFAYPGRPSALEDVSFAITAGETVALAGPNGAGKTTIVNLLLGFYAPQRGRILIDGCPMSEIPVTSLRRQIGLVPQMPLLFHGTIRDNIAFGAEDPAERQVLEAARLAQAADFIGALPDGMDTVIGDRGVRLSGGQRQRIALARALIKDPPILILDEATSMFDDEAEEGFVSVSSSALVERTVIVIAHRPATLELADRVILLQGGQVQVPQARRAR